MRAALILSLSLLSACVAMPPMGQGTRVDEVPMYGGMDRSQVPALRDADEKFIADVSSHYGSREKAARAWVEQGFKFYGQDQLGMAMRRFNQAWLLDPANAETYWGFASVLSDQDKYCDALKMVELAQSKGLMQPGFLSDAALIFTGCAMEGSASDPVKRQAYLTRSDELFSQALASPAERKEYTLSHWARAMYRRGDYAGAWTKVQQFRKETGKEFNERFLRALREKLPEPK